MVTRTPVFLFSNYFCVLIRFILNNSYFLVSYPRIYLPHAFSAQFFNASITDVLPPLPPSLRSPIHVYSSNISAHSLCHCSFSRVLRHPIVFFNITFLLLMNPNSRWCPAIVLSLPHNPDRITIHPDCCLSLGSRPEIVPPNTKTGTDNQR